MTSIDQTTALRSRIASLLAEKGSRVLPIQDIHERLRVLHPDLDLTLDEVRRETEEMERDGLIVAIRSKRYSLIELTPFVAGKIRVHPDGFGFVPQRGDEPDLYIDRRSMKGAMNGDVVLARVEKNASPQSRRASHKDRTAGEIVKVLRREHRLVVGRFHADEEFPFVRPFDFRLDADIEIDADETMGALDGQMVNVEIERYGDKSSNPSGRVVEILGKIGEPGVDIEVVIRKYQLAHRFPQEVLDEAENTPQEIEPSEVASRVDLRERNIVTIDGETAKDFDDAIEVARLPNGNFQLGVHIADVSYYVKEGGILDREAFDRGTSVYFPGRAVPMLPERLSNGICSLNPRVDRLTFSAQMEIDPKGRFVDKKFFRSVIRTKERMTYTNVHALLEAPTPELKERYAYLLDDFQRMHELYEVLRKRREGRGSIDFDLPAGEVLLTDAGEIESILPSQRNVAHRLIEEFMLAANEVVAEHLLFAQQPAVYRVHQPPDPQRIEDLKAILVEFNHRMRGDAEQIRPGELQKVLKQVAGTPEERFLTELILRSMKRALYSEECSGHFALALQYYCHFTSPIRRYPDLIVHRRLGELIASGTLYGDRYGQVSSQMPFMAAQSSEREKRAEDAEREVIEWKKVIFMRDKIGDQYTGTVTGVMAFGLFVELNDFFVQGLVPIASIGGDFWSFAEKEHRLRGSSTAREFRLGDQVVVEVKSIDEDRRQIEFLLREAGGEVVEPRRKWTRR
ncbi:MAG TPA: ribonuclease R [Thermoanaerobaculia bacterium]|nr:ribonuclease R [Thermoanaerobaculia bacterium]